MLQLDEQGDAQFEALGSLSTLKVRDPWRCYADLAVPWAGLRKHVSETPIVLFFKFPSALRTKSVPNEGMLHLHISIMASKFISTPRGAVAHRRAGGRPTSAGSSSSLAAHQGGLLRGLVGVGHEELLTISWIIWFCFGGVVIPLIFPKVPQSSRAGILRVPQLPPPLGPPPLRNALKNPISGCSGRAPHIWGTSTDISPHFQFFPWRWGSYCSLQRFEIPKPRCAVRNLQISPNRPLLLKNQLQIKLQMAPFQALVITQIGSFPQGSEWKFQNYLKPPPRCVFFLVLTSWLTFPLESIIFGVDDFGITLRKCWKTAILDHRSGWFL